jgi:hypothetical protein
MDLNILVKKKISLKVNKGRRMEKKNNHKWIWCQRKIDFIYSMDVVKLLGITDFIFIPLDRFFYTNINRMFDIFFKKPFR